jgi:hypothetical protein
METVTVYKHSYDDLNESYNAKSYEVSYLKGMITGLAMIAEDSPAEAARQLEELAEKIRAGVDITAL